MTDTHDIIYVYEGAQARLERSNKRLWILAIILIAALLLTNIGWVIYESQYQVVEESVRTTVEQDNDGGNNNFIGGNGDIVNGEAENNDSQNDQTAY